MPGLVFVLALICGGWFLQRDVGAGTNIYIHTRVLDEVMRHIENDFVDEVDPDELYEAAINSVVDGLDDPNSRFLGARDWEEERIRTQGDYAGVGIEVVNLDGFMTVSAPIPGTPAARAGIRPGDRIVEVDGEQVEGRVYDQAVGLLRGEPGTPVQVGVRRPGVERIITVELTRAVIHVPSVPFATMLEDGIGYVPLLIFNRTTTREVRAAMDSLAAQGMKSLILDLRDNRGGLLTEGVALTDLFLDRGKSIVEIRGRSAVPERYEAAREQSYPDLPVVVLVERTSASAAEILAGALQDHDRALLIGSTTFGKGSVQSLFPLPGGNVLKLTTARWFTPAGRSIEKDRSTLPTRLEYGPTTLQGDQAERPDLEDKPRFTSGGGRELHGGGGIVPDLWILQDTLTSPEQSALDEVLQSSRGFLAALQNWAVAYLNEHPDLEPGFRITDADLASFHAALKERGAGIPIETFLRARHTITFHLGSEIALLAWGDLGRFERVSEYDSQLQRAVELLGAAGDQAQLFALAGSPLALTAQAGDGSGAKDDPR